MTLNLRRHLICKVGVVYLILRDRTSYRSTVTVLVLWLRCLSELTVAINKSNSLNVIATMMIVFVTPHDQVFLGFFQA